MSRVFFIGAGPGDPELLTLKGAECLQRATTVFTPDPLNLTFAGLLEGKRVYSPFDYYFQELLDLVEECGRGDDVAFLVPGDLTFYAPFQALVDALGDRATVIPGVGTANAASARLKKTLDLPAVCNRAIIASPRTLGDGEDSPSLADLAAPGVTLLIYMNNLPLPDLVDQLRAGYGKSVPIALLHRLGLPGEDIVQGTLDNIVARVGPRDLFHLENNCRRPALTLVVVGETLTAAPDGSWWDFRRDQIWRHRS